MESAYVRGLLSESAMKFNSLKFQSKPHSQFFWRETAAGVYAVDAFDDAIFAPVHPEHWALAHHVPALAAWLAARGPALAALLAARVPALAA